MTKLKLQDIRDAHERIKDSVHMTPCVRSEILSQMLDCKLFLKLENQQITGSFKLRGALNKILQLNAEQKAAGVIAASAGNHAQGVAHAARQCDIKATIVMPETTPLTKVQGTQKLGASIILHGSCFDEAYEKATELQQQHGYTLIETFDDLDIIAGQGSIGLELLQQVPEMDIVVVPVGGGGLIAGIATAIKQSKFETRIIGVEAARIAAMKTSLAAGKVETLRFANTIADGISIARVGQHTLPLVSEYVSEIVTVTEEEIAHAIMALLEREKTLAEGAGAVGLAALRHGHISDIRGKKVVVVISGGNIDMMTLSTILKRGLEIDGRLVQLEIVVPDKPGNIAELAALIAEQDTNILKISQNRSASEVDLGETKVELLLEAKGWSHVEAITESIRQRGYRVK